MSSNSLTATNPAFDGATVAPESGEKRSSTRKSIEVHIASETLAGNGMIMPNAVNFDDVVEVNDMTAPRKSFEGEDEEDEHEGINMWKLQNVGLYCHYACVGILANMHSGVAKTACVYVLNGEKQYCNNISTIVFTAWSLKIFYAVATDLWWPFGLRRKPYIIFAWVGVLTLNMAVIIFFEHVTAEIFGLILLSIQLIFMVGNVPADGYSVQLAEYELPHFRGQILATGQFIRFCCSMLVALIQTFLLNGPATNSPSVVVAWNEGWTWGLSIPQFMAACWCLIAICVVPIFFMKEVSSEGVERRTAVQHFSEMWHILQSKTTFFLIVHGSIERAVVNLFPATYTYMQYYIIRIPALLGGIESLMSYFFLTLSVWIFKTFLINKNWRYTQYASGTLSASFLLLWLLAFHNTAGLRNGWFTVFISVGESFIEGVTQVLMSMAVVEISEPGLEATTYELIISITNSCGTLSTIIGTQLTSPFGVADVPTETFEDFEDGNGPAIYTQYTLSIMAIAFVGLIVSTRFLPTSREMCQQWKEEGEASGNSKKFGYASLVIGTVCITYGLIVKAFYFNPKLSCSEFVGGRGCDN